MFESEIELFQTLIPLIIAIIAAITAYIENQKKKGLMNELEYTNDIVQMENQKVNALISPKYADVDIVDSLPENAWKMSDETKAFLTSGAFKAYKPQILSQIAENEENRKVGYTIIIPNGVQYKIEYGLLKEQIGNT